VPERIIGGERTAKGSVAVTLTKVGDQDFSGPVTVTVFASTDNAADAGSDAKLAEVTKKLKIKGNAAAKPLKLKVQFPAVTSDGDYFILAQATGEGVAGGQSSAASAYSYLSLVDGTPMRHGTWAECERRVKGQSGARFKKAMSAADESAILRSWGVNPESL